MVRQAHHERISQVTLENEKILELEAIDSSPMTSLAPVSQARVQDVAEAVAREVNCQHGH